ncbi:type II toxin-antitoxin system RelE/ParE family toxin [Patescibacteria group bacterium]|nr:type II toxin-antitoxin system RelE/ParE family toxin [Candidatus Omnitrophota bacterium]MBU1128907.1 type II toxin-antitoxin system RelE/ParE family toxin [Candidatus Omnitrophota bacterium]MBU1685670.1 type II toxin-antitoxin system RelE/ParE family toxin [Patescibacteria group bacterium]MBU1784201.1 type II toxin-antitoxin system RelE/ParE family toxin [Candidatus Omnitrophota bacterium]MBU1852032.1 type II toxin-antitoxin system RelE/ParE family toxin [Candidatus Omnitrophota bacterium]
MYRLLLIPSARKDLDALPMKELSRIKDKILLLADDPRPSECLKLTGDGGYRIRKGDYRILYRVNDKEKAVYIYRIKHRREVYR